MGSREPSRPPRLSTRLVRLTPLGPRLGFILILLGLIQGAPRQGLLSEGVASHAAQTGCKVFPTLRPPGLAPRPRPPPPLLAGPQGERSQQGAAVARVWLQPLPYARCLRPPGPVPELRPGRRSEHRGLQRRPGGSLNGAGAGKAEGEAASPSGWLARGWTCAGTRGALRRSRCPATCGSALPRGDVLTDLAFLGAPSPGPPWTGQPRSLPRPWRPAATRFGQGSVSGRSHTAGSALVSGLSLIRRPARPSPGPPGHAARSHSAPPPRGARGAIQDFRPLLAPQSPPPPGGEVGWPEDR